MATGAWFGLFTIKHSVAGKPSLGVFLAVAIVAAATTRGMRAPRDELSESGLLCVETSDQNQNHLIYPVVLESLFSRLLYPRLLAIVRLDMFNCMRFGLLLELRHYRGQRLAAMAKP